MEDHTIPWEDHLLERKTDRQLKDIRRTAVAFANSVKPGHVAIMLVGESNDGSVSGVPDVDKMQRELRSEFENIYPPILFRQLPYEKDGKSCIRIEIEHSGETPHFADAAWIRKDNQSVRASDAMLQKLIELRSSKVRELMIWLGKRVSLSWSAGIHGTGPNWSRVECELVRVTGFFATFKRLDNHKERSEPINWLELGWDDIENRLRIFVDPKMRGLE